MLDCPTKSLLWCMYFLALYNYDICPDFVQPVLAYNFKRHVLTSSLRKRWHMHPFQSDSIKCASIHSTVTLRSPKIPNDTQSHSCPWPHKVNWEMSSPDSNKRSIHAFTLIKLFWIHRFLSFHNRELRVNVDSEKQRHNRNSVKVGKKSNSFYKDKNSNIVHFSISNSSKVWSAYGSPKILEDLTKQSQVLL